MFRRPSKYHHIEVRFSRLLPPKGYFAITFFGKILIRSHNSISWEQSKEQHNNKVILHHEWIHVRQAVSTHNSWICFYLQYLYYYLKNKPLRYGRRFAYYANPFEMEAYIHENDLTYAQDTEKGTYGWRHYATMPLVQRQKICQDFMRMRE